MGRRPLPDHDRRRLTAYSGSESLPQTGSHPNNPGPGPSELPVQRGEYSVGVRVTTESHAAGAGVTVTVLVARSLALNFQVTARHRPVLLASSTAGHSLTASETFAAGLPVARGFVPVLGLAWTRDSPVPPLGAATAGNPRRESPSESLGVIASGPGQRSPAH